MLNAGDKFGGFLAQSMGGPKSVSVEYPSFISPGTFTFTAPWAGVYKFIAWGAGGAGGGGSTNSGGGGSGAYGEVARYLTQGQQVAIGVGAGAYNNVGSAGGNTFLMLPDGTCTLTGGRGTSSAIGGLGGMASGPWDYSLPGSAGATWGGAMAQVGQGTGGGAAGANGPNNGGGAGAPARLPYLGGAGIAADLQPTSSLAGVGAGCGAKNATNNNPTQAGNGAVLIKYLRPYL